MNRKRADTGVTELVGTMLLLGMSITLFSLLSFVVLSYPFTPPAPSVDLVGTVYGDTIILEHCGGDALSLETKVVLTIGDSRFSFVVGEEEYLESASKEDGVWNVGEQVVFEKKDLTNLLVKATVIDVESNSVLLMGTLQQGELSTPPMSEDDLDLGDENEEGTLQTP